jgi:hypothetical protein
LFQSQSCKEHFILVEPELQGAFHFGVAGAAMLCKSNSGESMANCNVKHK